jgi:hypothetical protein
MSWTFLSLLGRLRIFQFSYIILIAVPLLAKVLSHLNSEHELHLLGTTFHISLGLPFSWKILYYSSICFVIATTVYNLFWGHRQFW